MSNAPTGGSAGRRETIDPSGLRELLERLDALLAARREHIDALNVFPVPDGDTGTNLLLTIRSALDEEPGEAGPLAALARGALVGARGNSGVIMSQVVRALSDTVEEHGELDGAGLAQALDRARQHAYEAVADPVEGTMLTAIRVASGTADELDDDAGLQVVAAAVLDAVRGAVDATTHQLEALRDAGVVDAGALGFQCLCEALYGLIHGTAAASADDLGPPPVVHRAGPTASREAGSLEYRFEVQYLLRAGEDAVAPLKQELRRIGDSVVVTSAEDLLNVHVHTNDIGPAIEAGLTYGRPWRIQVTSFVEQITEGQRSDPEESDRGPAGEGRGREPGAGDDGAVPNLACVCVLPGGGLRDLATEIGCVVVPGAAGSLPSVADVLNAVGETRGESVVVLPGHPNAVPTSEQAAKVSAAEGGRRISVVGEADAPTRVIAALAVWDAEGEPETVLSSMAGAAAAGDAGEVVSAVRDADTPVGAVRSGQMLSVHDGQVIAVRDDAVDALTALADACEVGSAEIVTLIVGADVAADERERAVGALEAAAEGAELQVIDGEQRPVRYFLGVE